MQAHCSRRRPESAAQDSPCPLILGVAGGVAGGGVRGALPLGSRGLLGAWVIGVHPPFLTFLTTATIVWLARGLWSTRVANTHRFANAFSPPLAC